ncbi:MAG: helix-turn-helix domain-containing protein [Rhodospirillaceae bacterium]|nr:helix-turn-helix domain-containing protein [Rhodospirillaceae bacterium]MBL6930136.1 helix-turn-helix domain-containing protein [Rhodospirillales bacterium]MBL6940840.1 helix-turn-helix domain-containing protein [Rhodospirillales bacterium]
MKNKPQKNNQKVIEQHIGIRLRHQRLTCGLTPEAVDKLIGGRPGKTKAFEKGACFVGPGDLVALSSALGVDVSFFFKGAEKDITKPAPLMDAPAVVEDAKQMVQAYYAIEDPGLRRSVVDLLKDIAEDESF